MAAALLAGWPIKGNSSVNGFTTGAGDSTGADLLIAVLSSYAAQTRPTLSDSKGGTWVADKDQADTDPTSRVTIFSCKPSSVGSGHTFTIAGTGVYSSLIVYAFSGSAAASYFDQSASAFSNGATSLASGSATPGQANEIVIAALSLFVDTTGLTGPSGFSTPDLVTGLTGDHLACAAAYQIQTTATARNPSWSWTNTAKVSAAIATYKAVSVGAALAASPGVSVSLSARLTAPVPLSAAPGIRVGISANLVAGAAQLAASPGIGVGISARLAVASPLAASPGIRFGVSATMAPATLTAAPGIRFSTVATLRTGVELLHASRSSIQLAGVDARIRVAGLTIHDVLNDAPNTCSLTIDGSETPVDGQSLRVSINLDAPRLLFNGALQTLGQSYQLKKNQLVWPASAIDDTPRANRRRPFGAWTTVSATTVVQYLMAVFAPGFTLHVQLGLPTVSIILDGSEGMNGALKQITDLIGGWFFWDDGALWLFNDPTFLGAEQPDDIDDTPKRFLDDPKITASIDNSQLRTRSFGKGHGEAILADVLANESIIPVANAAAWFGTVNPGGKAIALSQILAYTSVQLGGGGSLVGPGIAPSTAPTLAAAAGSGLGIGYYGYATVDRTAAGPTLPGPVGVVQTLGAATIADPTLAPTAAADSIPNFSGSAPNFNATGNPPHIGDSVQYAYSWSTATAYNDFTKDTSISPASAAFTVPQDAWYFTNYGWTMASLVDVTVPANADARINWIHVWRKRNGGAWGYIGVINANGSNGWYMQDGAADSATVPPTANAIVAARQQVTVTGIALGASPTTSRDVYRTAVQTTAAAALTAQLKLLTNLANNTSTGPYTDSTADGSLGANAPTGDTSGIPSVDGQVNAGSTSLLTASAGPFQPGGGWTTTGIRYTGITGNTLTGIPATGPGAILTTLKYGSPILPAPALVGVTGVGAAIVAGTPINIWVQRDDLPAQAEQAAIDLANGTTPADGIYEAAPITDARRGEASLTALCDATLARYSRPLVTVTYACRDVKTKSGRPVTINLASPSIHRTLTIQEVTIDQIDIAPGLLPRFAVTASSDRTSLDGLIRQLLAAAS
jgi:hypothetical protein